MISVHDYLKNNAENTGTDTLTQLPPETLLKDSDKAVKRIIKAVNAGEKILIFGHDDADGITSAYIFHDFFKTINYKNFDCFIPNRMIENHGIGQNLINYAVNGGFSLILVVDNGINSAEAVDTLNSHHKETIIIDHHLIPENIPNAYAIVNAKQADCSYPEKMLSGVGTVWMVIRILCQSLNK